MKHIIFSALTLCLSAIAMTATAQNVTIQKQGGVGHVYEVEQVDSVVYFPIGDAEQFPAPETENTTTLWDIIQAQPNLKKFAAIMEAAAYYDSQYSGPTELHFGQVLGGSVPLNVYAPTDAAIGDALYAQLLDLAQTNGRQLLQEFVFNHISPIETPSVGEDVVTMLNGKHVKGSAIGVISTIGEAATGSVYALSSVLPYSPNMMEYLMETAPDCGLAREFIAKYDTLLYDNPSNAISTPSMNGWMTCLKDGFTIYNRMMSPYVVSDNTICVKGYGADLANESASFKMVMPTDAVWNDAQAKLAQHYVYSSRYEDKKLGDEGNTGSAIRIFIDNPDSISALSMKADILVPLLCRTSDTQAAALSNGTAYSETTWPVPVSEYKPDVEVEIEDLEVFYNIIAKKNTIFGPDSKNYSFSNEEFKKVTDIYGQVSNDDFYYLAPQSASKGPIVEIKLQGNSPTAYVPNAQVMSGKYDIQVVFVPYWYRIIAMAGSMEPFYKTEYETVVNPEDENDVTYVPHVTEELDEDSILSYASNSKYLFKAYITYNQASGTEKSKMTLTSKAITYDGLRVDTITVAENFEFPVSYKYLRKSYPTLILENAKRKENGYVFDLCIDKIILKSKEDGTVIEVTP